MKVARDFKYKFNKRAVNKACSPRTFTELLRETRLTKNEKGRAQSGFITIDILMELHSQFPQIPWIGLIDVAVNPAKERRGKTTMEEIKNAKNTRPSE